MSNRDLEGQDGCHLDDDGAPYALIEARPGWSLVASHECIEMILNPYGNRRVGGPGIKQGQVRVEYLLEACDPCQDEACAYTVNDVLVSDFVTPAYFDPAGVEEPRYCFSGRSRSPGASTRAGT